MFTVYELSNAGDKEVALTGKWYYQFSTFHHKSTIIRFRAMPRRQNEEEHSTKPLIQGFTALENGEFTFIYNAFKAYNYEIAKCDCYHRKKEKKKKDKKRFRK